MKFSSASLQICYIDSLYHTHQYVHDFKLIYFIIFCIFRCFFIVFTNVLRKIWPENVSYEVLIRFTSNLLHGFIVSYSSMCGCLQAYICYYFSAFLVFLTLFYLEKCGLGKTLRFLIKSSFLSSSHQNHFKFTTCTWIHCLIHYIMCMISS